MNGTGKTGSSSQRPLGQAPERPFAWPRIAKFHDLQAEFHPLRRRQQFKLAPSSRFLNFKSTIL
jgi:hypothetical protein